MQSADNPDGPLTQDQAATMTAGLTKDEDTFYDGFTTDFFSADGKLTVSEAQRQEALALCGQADKKAALACMTAIASTDFRDDLGKVDVPTLVMQGDKDFIVFYEGSGQRTRKAVPSSQLHTIAGGPHGCNVSHAAEWNSTLLTFLQR